MIMPKGTWSLIQQVSTLHATFIVTSVIIRHPYACSHWVSIMQTYELYPYLYKCLLVSWYHIQLTRQARQTATHSHSVLVTVYCGTWIAPNDWIYRILLCIIWHVSLPRICAFILLSNRLGDMVNKVKLEEKYMLLKLLVGLLVSVTCSFPAIVSAEISQKGMDIVYCDNSQ